MQLTIQPQELTNAVDEIMKKRGYVPENSVIGKTITLKEFSHKYCARKTTDWIKRNILYEFKPDWVADLYPGTGRQFIIFEYPASVWMNQHRKEIDWNAK